MMPNSGAVARNTLHGGDQLVIPDAAVVRPGDCTQRDPAVIGFQRLHQRGPVRQQPCWRLMPASGAGSWRM